MSPTPSADHSGVRRHCWVGVRAGLALLGLAASLNTPAAEPPSLQVVRVAHADPIGLRQAIIASQGGCAARLQLPMPAFPAALTEGVLARFMVRRQEEYFSGARWAQYDTERTIFADPAQGCQLATLTRRRAESEINCRDRQAAGNPTLGELMQPGGPQRPLVSEFKSPGHQGCSNSRQPLNLQGAVVDTSGPAPCIWRGALLAQRWQALAAKLGRPVGGEAGESFDTCLSADMPEYITEAGRRPVVLMHRLPPLKGGTGQTLHTTEQRPLLLDKLQKGEAIAEQRFSAEALRAFVSQPVISALGD